MLHRRWLQLKPSSICAVLVCRLLEANADGSQLAVVDANRNMSIYALNRGQAPTMHLEFQAQDVSSLAWNSQHAEVLVNAALYVHEESQTIMVC
jgi:hypothetical protein